jgi:hypothetical protein
MSRLRSRAAAAVSLLILLAQAHQIGCNSRPKSSVQRGAVHRSLSLEDQRFPAVQASQERAGRVNADEGSTLGELERRHSHFETTTSRQGRPMDVGLGRSRRVPAEVWLDECVAEGGAAAVPAFLATSAGDAIAREAARAWLRRDPAVRDGDRVDKGVSRAPSRSGGVSESRGAPDGMDTSPCTPCGNAISRAVSPMRGGKMEGLPNHHNASHAVGRDSDASKTRGVGGSRMRRDNATESAEDACLLSHEESSRVAAVASGSRQDHAVQGGVASGREVGQEDESDSVSDIARDICAVGQTHASDVWVEGRARSEEGALTERGGGQPAAYRRGRDMMRSPASVRSQAPSGFGMVGLSPRTPLPPNWDESYAADGVSFPAFPTRP